MLRLVVQFCCWVVLLFVCLFVSRSLLGFGCFSRLALCGWLPLRCQPRASSDKALRTCAACSGQAGEVLRPKAAQLCSRGLCFLLVLVVVVVGLCLFVVGSSSDLSCFLRTL